MLKSASDTPVDRCRYYRDVCGLPAVIHPTAGCISVAVGAIGAVTMPAALGMKVRARLRRTEPGRGPIILHPRSSRWTFLVDRDDYADLDRQFSTLFGLNVTVAALGAEIALPTPHVGGEADPLRVWIELPGNNLRPSVTRVVAAVLSSPATDL
ncbi:DNA-directed RNA polymerase subunit beta [Nocardia puris]|nr:DNA-directed RNA polymerase subunit beta [Nocardia puris]